MKGRCLRLQRGVLGMVREVQHARSMAAAEVVEVLWSGTSRWWWWRWSCTLVWGCLSWCPGSGSHIVLRSNDLLRVRHALGNFRGE